MLEILVVVTNVKRQKHDMSGCQNERWLTCLPFLSSSPPPSLPPSVPLSLSPPGPPSRPSLPHKNVRPHAVVVACELLPRPAEPRLHLVRDEEHVVPPASGVYLQRGASHNIAPEARRDRSGTM